MAEDAGALFNSQAWTEGVRDAYTGLASRPAAAGSNRSYALGRIEGELLRRRHRHEYEQLLFSGRQTKEPNAGPPNEE